MENIIVDSNISIRESIKKLDVTAKKILFVTDDQGKLVGTVTDGDIRRWILKNGDFDKEVYNIMNKNPIYINKNKCCKAKEIMEKNSIEALPIVDENLRIIDVIFWNEKNNINYKLYDNITTPVVIMAGGKGTRLYPYTHILPKPLIPIGEVSITERIIERFEKFGCREFYLTVNYKKNMIKAYFDDLPKKYKINYVEEEEFLGTAGSLFFLKDKINETFFVSNCDILVDANYYDILRYHKEKNNIITMVTSLKNYKIPYGVIKLNDKGEVIGTVEKPQYDYLVNAGVYVLEPEALNDIPKNKFFHITDLIDKYIKDGKKVGTYPITENAWLDMGEIKEMERMLEKLKV